MPITATQKLLETQIKTAFSLDKGAEKTIISLMLATAIASSASAGLLPSAPSPIPLIPCGLTAGQTLIQNSMSLDKMATQDLVAQLIAQGVSVIAPMCPPVGLATLQLQLAQALKMDKGASPDLTAQLWSQAIIAYYSMGTII